MLLSVARYGNHGVGKTMIETIENRHFDLSVLTSNALVFDCGALGGKFASFMAGRGYRVIAFDPDAEAIGAMDRREGVTLVQKAIGFPAGPRIFYQFAPGNGANGLYLNEHEEKVHQSKMIPVEVITLQDAVDAYGVPELLKMNIEGSEIDVIMHSSDDLLRSIGQMTISFHAFCGFITMEQEEQARARLRSLGFVLEHFPPDDEGRPEDWRAVREGVTP